MPAAVTYLEDDEDAGPYLQNAAFLLASGLFLLLAGCASYAKAAAPTEAAGGAATPQTVQVEDLEGKWGIRIVGLRTTSGGYMLDFRFRVLDAQKAAPLFIRQTKPYLLDVRTGAKFQVPNPPKTGPLRTSDPPKEGIVYWMFFANPGQYLKPGNLATVVIGDFQAPDLVVE